MIYSKVYLYMSDKIRNRAGRIQKEQVLEDGLK